MIGEGCDIIYHGLFLGYHLSTLSKYLHKSIKQKGVDGEDRISENRNRNVLTPVSVVSPPQFAGCHFLFLIHVYTIHSVFTYAALCVFTYTVCNILNTDTKI